MAAVKKDERKELEDLVLQTLDSHGSIADTLTFLTPSPPSSSTPPLPFTHSLLTSVLQSLSAAAYVLLSPISHPLYQLTEEGETYATRGTPEGQLLLALQSAGGRLSLRDAESQLGKDVYEIGRGQAMKARWLSLDKDKGELVLKDGADVKDDVKDMLEKVKEGRSDDLDPKLIAELKKRKMILLRSAAQLSSAQPPLTCSPAHCPRTI